MSDDECFKRKSTRMAAIEAAKRIKKNAEDNAHKYLLHRVDIITQSDIATSNNNTHRQRACKQKKEEQENDSSQDSSNNSKCSNISKSDDMPRKRRGRPPKSKSTKCQSRRGTKAKYKDPKSEEGDYDVNLRRESYNNFVLNNEPLDASIFSGPKQLQLGNGGISYKESLMRFTKDLGPTAQKVALRMIQRQGPSHQARHQLEPFYQSPDSPWKPRVMDAYPTIGSVQNTITNQVNQPPLSFGDLNTKTISNYKGKNVMVDNGKNICNKWNVADNLEVLFGKQKGGVKIGNDSLVNRDYVNKNLDYSQEGYNQRTINPIGSSWSNYNRNFNQNANMVSWNASNGILNPPVYPSTNVSRSQNISSTCSGFDGEVGSFLWVPTPPATSINSVVNDSLWKEQELHLALSLNKQMKDQESNVWSQNLWAPNQANQLLLAHPLGPVCQRTQERLVMRMPPQFWSQMAAPRTDLEQQQLPFGTQHYPPPGI